MSVVSYSILYYTMVYTLKGITEQKCTEVYIT